MDLLTTMKPGLLSGLGFSKQIMITAAALTVSPQRIENLSMSE